MIVWKHMFLKIYKKVEVSKISSTSAFMALSMAEAINFSRFSSFNQKNRTVKFYRPYYHF